MCCAERRRGPRRFPLAVRAARTPDAPALIWRTDPTDPGFFRRGQGSPPAASEDHRGLHTLCYRDLDRLTTSAALAVRARGIVPGERVALRLPPGPAYPALLLALLRARAVAVPLSTRLPDAAVPELLGRVGCERLIVAGGGAAEMAAGGAVIAAADLLGAQPGAGELPPFNRRSAATIVFTSGSTGIPKAAVHTFENHWASAVGGNRNLPLGPGDRWLLSLPLWHVGGLAIVFRCLCAGAAIAIPGAGEPLADAIPALGATHVSLVATQLLRLLRDGSGRAALRGLTAVLLGGGPAPDALCEEARRAGVPLITSYGSTETSSQAAATRPGDPPEALRTAGRPLPFRELAVAADGEILARGRTLFRGYLEDETIHPARDAAGWFHTGDVGRFDAAGRLVVAGRRDTMFVSGGENIHPEEIERALVRFPGVLEAIVVPVPDPEFGARPAAFLRTADRTTPDAAALGRFLRESLPGFKVPGRYLAWPDLPEGLKPDRRALEALARGEA